MCLGGAFFAKGYEPRQTRFRGGGASLSDLCPASRSRRVITLRALTASRIMDPSPLVPGTLVWARIIYLLGEKSLCRSKQSLVSRPHSVYGPAAERTIDSFLRCRPLTSRRLAQPLRGHGIPSRVIASPYTGTAGASAVGPQPINTLYDTKERKEKKGLMCVVPGTASGPCCWEGGWLFCEGLRAQTNAFPRWRSEPFGSLPGQSIASSHYPASADGYSSWP